MEIISVKASGCYDVFVGNGLYANMASAVSAVTKARKFCIVSDESVWPLWGNHVQQPLMEAGYSCCHFLIPPGEAHKSIETCTEIWDFLAQEGFDRQDCLIALGGGVIGDLTGFAASAYQRGIDYIQIPTTLLAMVDSSVGGKTAVNLRSGKNLAGAFYQPKLVLCDIDTLSTLPLSQFLNGCAEVIKYAILFDPQLFFNLESAGPDFSREAVISQCIRYKAQTVCNDEFDRSERMLLNLGHTVGHAIEVLSGYTVPHGQAVAAGIAVVSGSAVQGGYLHRHNYLRILQLLQAFSLPIRTAYSAEALCNTIVHDKKRTANAVQLILPQDIGRCSILPMPMDALKDFIQKGL